jgi:hypothetical protein
MGPLRTPGDPWQSTAKGMQLSQVLARFNDGPQPVADLGCAANGVHDLARNPIPPDQIAAGRLCVQGAIVGGDRDNLGRLGAEALCDKLRGSDLDEGGRDRKSMLGVILGAEKAAPAWGFCGYRLNGGEFVRRQNLGVRRQGFDLVEVRTKRVENGRTGRKKRVGPAGFRHVPAGCAVPIPRVQLWQAANPSSSPRRARQRRRRPEQNRSAA